MSPRAGAIPHALAVANGTAALHLAYLAIGLKAGDEVIVPGFGFLAAANVALHFGAKPVFAEIDPATWCLTAEAVGKPADGEDPRGCPDPHLRQCL